MISAGSGGGTYVPIALVLDVTGHLIVDGVDQTRLVLASATRLSIGF